MTEPESITSPANPRVKQAATLREADARRATGLTLVDGRRELARAAEAGADVVEVFVTSPAGAADRTGDASFPDWLARLAARGTRIAVVSEKAFERIAFGDRDEGVVGVVRFGPRPLADLVCRPDRPLLVVEGAEKPGNLGAIVRTADAAGLGGVIIADPRTDVANPAVIRASLGTVFSMPLATASTAETIAWCRSHGRRVVAATPEGRRPWHEADLRGEVAILLGSEAHGITAAWATAPGLAFETVRLPMHGIADSLNLSATAAVLAYEAVRQREALP